MESVSKKIAIISATVMLLLSCSRNTPETQKTFLEAGARLIIHNADGSGNYLESINTDDIKLFYKDNGSLLPLTYPGDTPKGYIVYKEGPVNEKAINIFCYVGGTKTAEETYIRWNDNDMDTLSYNIARYENGISAYSFKYNGKPITNNNQYGIYYISK